MTKLLHFREHTTLGRTGLSVSRLGIGAGYGVPANAVERAYHEHEINYLYWSLPRRGPMRNAIRHLAKTERENMVVVVQSYDHFGFLMETFAERQLRKLGLEYADVFLLGWFNRFPNQRIWDTVHRLKETGRIRHVAMSGHHRPTFGKMAQRGEELVDIYMVRYNAVHKGAEEDIFPFLPAENRPGIVTYTTTCWGKLLKAKNMPPNDKPLSAADCYRFALSNSNVDLCLCGPTSEAQLQEDLTALDAGPMSEEELARARRIGDYIHQK